jgi:uncharacterized protein (DUF1697 family)
MQPGRSRYTAFLRAINTTGRYIKMQDLCQYIIDLGFFEVETFISSGNVIFSAPSEEREELESRIEAQILDKFGFDSPTFIRTAEQLRQIAEMDPFSKMNPQEETIDYVSFLKEEPSLEKKAKLLGYSSEFDRLHIDAHEVYWRRSMKHGNPRFSGATMEKVLKAPATLRNMKTIKRMVERLFPPG